MSPRITRVSSGIRASTSRGVKYFLGSSFTALPYSDSTKTAWTSLGP
jgi:hypothetical protein